MRWHELQDGFSRCNASRSLVVSSLPPSLPSVSSRSGTPGGGGGGGEPNKTSMTHLPRNTGEVRPACDVKVRILPCPNRPRLLSSGYVKRWNSSPVTPENP